MGQVMAKSLIPKENIKTRYCFKCQKTKPEVEFYMNKEWTDQGRRDIWCRECVRSLTSKDEVKEYFWENNRQFTENIWKAAIKKAESLLQKNAVYKRSVGEAKTEILEKTACSTISTVMQQMYAFENHVDKDGAPISFEDAVDSRLVLLGTDEEELVYSKEFNGRFSQSDLEYLDNYYARLEEDFNFDNENLRDYARKICKASLQSDKAQDAYAAGKVSYSDVKDAMNMFDTLSKSANFAACRRKTGEASGLTCWAETTLKLETTGHTIENKFEFPKDDIDKTIDELRHIVEALGLDSV